ncbi:MAG: DNA replication/repair protein RecF, partial [Sarcina sp.]
NYDKAYISLNVSKNRLDKTIDISILKDGKKAIKVNSIKINKIGELIGVFNVVMFSPEDLKIVKESPGVRRKFLDMEICQLNKKYYYDLVQYNKVLNQRNIILKQKNIEFSILDVYDNQLAQYGELIIKERLKYLNKLNKHAKVIHEDITAKKEKIEFKYIGSIKESDDIKSALLSTLEKNRDKDIDRKNTSIGPHRDDFIILINNVDAKSYGSQGQQRTAILTIKFASLRIIKEIIGEYPVLLLDDVLSELDFNRKKYVLSSIADIQTIITCTGIEDLTNYLDDKTEVFKVREGYILN